MLTVCAPTSTASYSSRSSSARRRAFSPGDPTAPARRLRQAPVERRCPLAEHEGPAAPAPGEEFLVLPRGGPGLRRRRLGSRRSRIAKAASLRLRPRGDSDRRSATITRAIPAAWIASVHGGVLPVVVARLEGHVEVSAPGPASRLTEGQDLRVRPAGSPVAPFARPRGRRGRRPLPPWGWGKRCSGPFRRAPGRGRGNGGRSVTRLLVPQKGSGVLRGVKRHEVVHSLPDADEEDGQPQLAVDRQHDARRARFRRAWSARHR